MHWAHWAYRWALGWDVQAQPVPGRQAGSSLHHPPHRHHPGHSGCVAPPTTTPLPHHHRQAQADQAGPGWTRQAQAGASKQAQADMQAQADRLRQASARPWQAQAHTQPRQAQAGKIENNTLSEETIQAKRGQELQEESPQRRGQQKGKAAKLK